jgi:hypothetical protein
MKLEIAYEKLDSKQKPFSAHMSDKASFCYYFLASILGSFHSSRRIMKRAVSPFSSAEKDFLSVPSFLNPAFSRTFERPRFSG